MKKRFAFFAVVAFVMATSQDLTADTVFIEATQDNTLYESSTGRLSNGAGEHFFVGMTQEQFRRRGVIAFKDLSVIPAGATITSVRLHLMMSKQDSAANIIRLHRISADWGEGASDAPEQEGGGANSEPNDATWIHAFFSGFNWGVPGGDFNETPSAELLVNDVGAYMFESNESLIADVTRWRDSPNDNFGWILIGDETRKSARRFDSKDHSNPTRHPMLEVTFSGTGTSSDFSGAWYDPTLEGEGYLIYQTPGGWLIYYFGYSSDMNFLWLTSPVVPLADLVLGEPFDLPMLIGKPGTFTNPGPSADLTPYGTLSVTFNSCGSGVFVLDGQDGKKTSSVAKLVGVDGTVCE